MTVDRKALLTAVKAWKTEKRQINLVKIYVDNFITFEHANTKKDYKVTFETVATCEFKPCTIEYSEFVKILQASKAKLFSIEQGENALNFDHTFKIPLVDLSSKMVEFSKFKDYQENDRDNFVIGRDSFTDIMNLVVPHISGDEIRYFMNGILFEHKEGENFIRVVGTDGRTLSYKTVYCEDYKYLAEFAHIVDIKGLKVLQDTDIHIKINEKFCSFKSSKNGIIQETVVCVIDGKFPLYERVIPENNKLFFDVETKEFADALKKITPFIDKKSTRVFLNFREDVLYLENFREDIKVSFPVKCVSNHSDNILFCFNVKYLLRSIDGEKTTINFTNDAMKAVTIHSNACLRVIMPMLGTQDN